MQTNSQHSFLLPSTNGIAVIYSNNIIRIEASSNYSKLFFANGSTIVVAKVLKWFLPKLPAQQFLRVHRKHIVNMEFIDNYCNGKILLHNTQLIDVSKRKRVNFLKCFHSNAA